MEPRRSHGILFSLALAALTDMFIVLGRRDFGVWSTAKVGLQPAEYVACLLQVWH